MNLYKYYINNNKDFNIINGKVINNNSIKNYPSSVREWNNSIYTFNKDYIKLLPETSKLSINIIKSYFNLYNSKLENKLNKIKIKNKLKKLSFNKIYVSDGTFKHTNNKVIIQLYIYNRQKINYTYIIKKNFNKKLKYKLINKLLLINRLANKFANVIEINKKIVDIIINKTNNNFIANKYKNLITVKIIKNILIKNLLIKYSNYFYYKQLIYINKSKFNYNYLNYLYSILKKIYNKNIQFNIVNQKQFYYNSDILTQPIILKIRRSRRKSNKIFKSIINKSKIGKVSKFLIYQPKTKNIYNLNKEPISNIIFNNLYINKKTIKNTALGLISYKMITGIRIEAKGRLTRRYTASRSISKLKYKGNLINIDSSYLKLSSVILKGNLKSNLQYTKSKAKTRIGSFGLKGWISGY